MKRTGLSILAVLVLGAGLYLILSTHQRNTAVPRLSTRDAAGGGTAADSGESVSGSTADDTTSPAAVTPSAVSHNAISTGPATDSLLPDDLDSIRENHTAVPLDTIPGSITALVNRDYLLPASYVPTDLTEPKVRFSFNYKSDKRKLRKPASKALQKMFRAAEKKGIILYAVSGYRSYSRQKQIYDRNVAVRGKSATDTVSARPGSSEHQTGLTIDISARSVGCQLSQAFANTKEGKWVAKNAHKYGYIIRYPSGKSKITGYHYEPWHIRYVGDSTAAYLYKNELTLEEYYNVSISHDGHDTSVDVEDPDSVKFATSKPGKKKK